jgi:hypothetical protein
MQSENKTPTGYRWPWWVCFGHPGHVAMESEWPADWAMYTGNNTGLGFDLLWIVGIAAVVWVYLRQQCLFVNV